MNEQFNPKRRDTLVGNDEYFWLPVSWPAFLEEMEELSKTGNYFYRGQRKAEWLLDSKFARKLKEENGVDLTSRYAREALENTSLQHEQGARLIESFDSIELSSELQAFTGIDPYFEFYRHNKQNPSNSFLGDEFNPMLEFSQDWKIALFFANQQVDYSKKSTESRVLFVVNPTAIGPVMHLDSDATARQFEKIREHLKTCKGVPYGGLPLLIYPSFQINNLKDQKPTNQKAVYFFQTDSRFDLGLSWDLLEKKTRKQVYIKILLPPNSEEEVNSFLEDHEINSNYIFPPSNFDKN